MHAVLGLTNIRTIQKVQNLCKKAATNETFKFDRHDLYRSENSIFIFQEFTLFIGVLRLDKSAYHNVKLVRMRDKLHASVINDEIICFDHWIVLGNFVKRSHEHTITFLHDVCLVDTCDLLSTFTESEVECKLKK